MSLSFSSSHRTGYRRQDRSPQLPVSLVVIRRSCACDRQDGPGGYERERFSVHRARVLWDSPENRTDPSSPPIPPIFRGILRQRHRTRGAQGRGTAGLLLMSSLETMEVEDAIGGAAVSAAPAVGLSPLTAPVWTSRGLGRPHRGGTFLPRSPGGYCRPPDHCHPIARIVSGAVSALSGGHLPDNPSSN